MALDNFIPEIWAARILYNMQKAQVYAQAGIVNRDYEGDIREAGDTVRINAIGAVTVSNYVKNTDMAAPETLSDAQTTLLINQAKYFNFQIDDVDRAQQRPQVMDAAMREAAYRLSDAADSYLAGLYTDVAAANWIGSDASPIVPDAATMYENLVGLKVILDENNVPTAGRWAIIPPWCHGLLLKDDRFVKYGGTQQEATARNGEVGEAAGFRILLSNNVVNVGGAKYKLLAGTADAWTYAEQLSRVEAYRPQLRFADAVKGLHLYGAKVVRPDGMAVLVASKS